MDKEVQLAKLKANIYSKLDMMRIPLRLQMFAEKEFDLDRQPTWSKTDIETLFSQAKASLERGRWVTFRGNAGVGKTHLAVKWLWELRLQKLELNTSCFRFLSSRTWARDMAMAGFRSEEMAEEIMEAEYLILDDLGQEGESRRSQAICDLIWDCYNDYKTLIITTNLSNQDIVERYGDPMLSRLQGEGNMIINLNGRDCR